MSMYLIVQNDEQVLVELAVMNIQRKGIRSMLHAWPARSRTNYLVQISWPDYADLLAKPWYGTKVVYATDNSDIVIDAWREALSPQFMAGQNPTNEQRDQHWAQWLDTDADGIPESQENPSGWWSGVR